VRHCPAELEVAYRLRLAGLTIASTFPQVEGERLARKEAKHFFSVSLSLYYSSDEWTPLLPFSQFLILQPHFAETRSTDLREVAVETPE
jgi:hypothetical protein